MPNGLTKKTALAPNVLASTPGPLPGTEPGAGSFKLRVNWRVLVRLVRVFVILAVVLAVVNAVFMMPSTVQLGDATYNVKVADEHYEQTIGLSDTTSLKPNEGMLFVFSEPDFYPIWMKDMDFAIDIIWLDADRKVVGLHKNITPDTYPNAYLPKDLALYVLELPAGSADAAGIAEGQTAKFDLKF